LASAHTKDTAVHFLLELWTAYTLDLGVLPSDCFQCVFGFRPTVVVNPESYTLIVYKIIVVGMVTIIMMMTTGKRKVVPATENVHISFGPRIIPALRSKGHIRF
jgi:hypothetical protein